MTVRGRSPLARWVAEYSEEAMLADGLDDAIIGICEGFASSAVVAYDRDKCIEILAKDFTKANQEQHDPDTDFYEQAVEYFDFNVAGAYVGENTPVFITVYPRPYN